MKQLKAENVTTCVSLLKGFINDAQALSSEKTIAVLALDQLKRVTAGTESTATGCHVRPRIYGTLNNG